MCSLYLDFGLTILVILVAYTDLKSRHISNRLLAIGLSFSLLIKLMSEFSVITFFQVCAGLITGFLIFLPLYCLRGMAAGDIKFMAVVGAFNTPIVTLNIAWLAVLLGGFMSIIVLYTHNKNYINILPLLLRNNKKSKNLLSIPYGVAISCSTLFFISQHYYFLFI